MKDIKTKAKNRTPRVLSNAARAPKELAHNSAMSGMFYKVKKQVREAQRSFWSMSKYQRGLTTALIILFGVLFVVILIIGTGSSVPVEV